MSSHVVESMFYVVIEVRIAKTHTNTIDIAAVSTKTE